MVASTAFSALTGVVSFLRNQVVSFAQNRWSLCSEIRWSISANSPHRIGKWLSLKPSNGLQKINIYVSTLGVLASVSLSILAVRLTYKYGESTTQISKLTEIANKQQIEVQKLVEILQVQKKQIEFSDKQLKELITSNNVLANQGIIFNKQLLALNSQGRLIAGSLNTEDKAGFTKFYEKIYSILGTGSFQVTTNDHISYHDQLATLQKIDELLEPELQNPYVIKTDSLQLKLYGFLGIVRIALNDYFKKADITNDDNRPLPYYLHIEKQFVNIWSYLTSLHSTYLYMNSTNPPDIKKKKWVTVQNGKKIQLSY